MTGNGENGTEKSRERKFRAGPRNGGEHAVDAPTLGYVPTDPDSPAPALTDPKGDAATSYRQALDRIQAATSARILLVTPARPGNAAAVAALNLGIAATRVGLRAVVIDGAHDESGPSQYLRTGSGPGLTDLAAGTVELPEASRLMLIDEGNRLPLIPAGSADAAADFSAADIADAVDRIHEHSDLILVVTPADAPAPRAAALGAHADGTVLVIDSAERPSAISDAAERSSEVGAPVVGLIELAAQKRKRRRSRNG